MFFGYTNSASKWMHVFYIFNHLKLFYTNKKTIVMIANVFVFPNRWINVSYLFSYELVKGLESKFIESNKEQLGIRKVFTYKVTSWKVGKQN